MIRVTVLKNSLEKLTQIPHRATAWSVAEDGCLHVFNESEVVATYASGRWHRVERAPDFLPGFPLKFSGGSQVTSSTSCCTLTVSPGPDEEIDEDPADL